MAQSLIHGIVTWNMFVVCTQILNRTLNNFSHVHQQIGRSQNLMAQEAIHHWGLSCEYEVIDVWEVQAQLV